MSEHDAQVRRDQAYHAMIEANKNAVKMRAASGNHQEVRYSNGTDVQYRRVLGATDEEVWAANKAAYEAQKEYEAAQRDVASFILSPEEVERRRVEREQQEQEKKEREAADHQAAFDNVKRVYKAQSRMQRFLNFIQGRKPNWNAVVEYSTEELKFLDTLSRGRSLWQEKTNGERWERREKNGMSLREMRKLENERNMKDFLNGLNSAPKLRSDLAYEKSARGIQ